MTIVSVGPDVNDLQLTPNNHVGISLILDALHDAQPTLSEHRRQRADVCVRNAILAGPLSQSFPTLFHRHTRAFYVYNGCLAWYNVVLPHGSTQA